MLDRVGGPLKLPHHKARTQPHQNGRACEEPSQVTRLHDLADDIAYGVHDLEAVIAIGLVDEAKFREAVDASKGSVAKFRVTTIGGIDPGQPRPNILWSGKSLQQSPICH
jgi:hypothetical protein